MLIGRTSPLTGQINHRDVDVTPDEMRAWQGGKYIQNAMPRASADDREFVLTGHTPEDWSILFPSEEEE